MTVPTTKCLEISDNCEPRSVPRSVSTYRDLAMKREQTRGARRCRSAAAGFVSEGSWRSRTSALAALSCHAAMMSGKLLCADN